METVLRSVLPSRAKKDRGTPDRDISKAGESYKYTALQGNNTIRVLELLPGSHEPLQCKLCTIELKREAQFEALSYTWGQPEFLNTLQVVPSMSNFKITNNLRDALQALRLSKSSRLLWVDAVCINQTDDEEKAHQVGMMKEIYQGAKRVIVWLGKESDDAEALQKSNAGFVQLEEIGRNCSLYGFDKVYPPFPRNINDRSAFEHLKKLAREFDGPSLLGIYDREWYERVWVVQEFVLAKDLTLRCGSLCISYDLFSKATAVFRLMGRYISIQNEMEDNPNSTSVLFGSGFNQAWRLISQRERYWGMSATQYNTSLTQRSVYGYEDPVIRPSSIIEYCAFAPNLKCTKEVDRIYGMLGFAHNSGLTVAVDYKSSTEAVWENLARQTLLLGDLTVLHYAGIPTIEGSKVRSFAADFGQIRQRERLGGHGHPRFHAATTIPPKIEIEPDGCVRVHAIKIDTVNKVNDGHADLLYIRVRGDTAREVSESVQSGFSKFQNGRVHRLYQWWMTFLNVEGLPNSWYDDKMYELAFRRTIIADAALPGTKSRVGSFSMQGLDLLFIIYTLAEEATDEDGNTNKIVDTWKVYELMGKPMNLALKEFQEDPPTTYFFPTYYGEEKGDRMLHQFVELQKERQQPGADLFEEIESQLPPELRSIKITSALKDRLNDYEHAISSVLSHRTMFFTNARLLGIAPAETQPGDVIMVPEGSQTPFVYRPSAKPEGYVRRGQLIGESYVHGLMDGDSVDKLQENYKGSHIEVVLI